jgi:hypothetical protein
MKRRWFHIHVSTAVMLMFVAGGLLWANLTPRTVYEDDSGMSILSERPFETARAAIESRGWPYEYYQNRTLKELNKLKLPRSWRGPSGEFWWKDELLKNLGICICIVVGTATALEYLIRRRGASNP